MIATIDDVVAFWREAGPQRWFEKNHAFDNDFRERLFETHLAAARRELDDWLESPNGALALMILLDQLPRNCFRGTGHMYATDPLARRFARRAIELGHDLAVESPIRAFFYMPLSHSENLADQEEAVRLQIPLGEELPNMRAAIVTSLPGSAVSRIATRSLAVTRHPRSRPISTMEGSRADAPYRFHQSGPDGKRSMPALPTASR